MCIKHRGGWQPGATAARVRDVHTAGHHPEGLRPRGTADNENVESDAYKSASEDLREHDKLKSTVSSLASGLEDLEN